MISNYTKDDRSVTSLTNGSNKLVKRTCDHCGRQDWVKYYNINKSRRINQRDQDYCTKCSYKFRLRQGGPKRNPNGCVDNKGYVCHYIRGKKYLTHRMTAELILRRKLRDDEFVHHIDCDKTNNNWNNLLICSAKEHAGLHAQLEAVAMLAVQNGIIKFDGKQYYLSEHHENL